MAILQTKPQARAELPAILTKQLARRIDESTTRKAYSPAEFAATCGRHPSWAYRLLYGGKVRALTDLGRILIPASELERVLASAAPYDPKPRGAKTQQSHRKSGGKE